MKMKGYSYNFSGQECAASRLEDINVSYKDLAEVCGRIRNKNSNWAIDFLKSAADGKAAVLYKTYNKRMGHRRSLGGKKGRYPKKAAAVVLNVLKSAVANGEVKGMGSEYLIVHAAAGGQHVYPRLAPKGRQSRSNLSTSRVEIVLKSTQEVPAGVEVKPPAKPSEKQASEKPKSEKQTPKKTEKKKSEEKSEQKPVKKDEKPKEVKKSEEKKEEKPPDKKEAAKEKPKKEVKKEPPKKPDASKDGNKAEVKNKNA